MKYSAEFLAKCITRYVEHVGECEGTDFLCPIKISHHMEGEEKEMFSAIWECAHNGETVEKGVERRRKMKSGVPTL